MRTILLRLQNCRVLFVVRTTAADASSSGHTRAVDRVLRTKKKKQKHINTDTFKTYEIVCEETKNLKIDDHCKKSFSMVTQYVIAVRIYIKFTEFD